MFEILALEPQDAIGTNYSIKNFQPKTFCKLVGFARQAEILFKPDISRLQNDFNQFATWFILSSLFGYQ